MITDKRNAKLRQQTTKKHHFPVANGISRGSLEEIEEQIWFFKQDRYENAKAMRKPYFGL